MHDVHAHLFHPKWYPSAFVDAFVRKCARSSAAVTQLLKLMSDDTGQVTLQIMDRVGIERRSILILDWGLELGEAATPIGQIHREILAICREHPDRFVGFTGIDPRRSDASEIIETAFDDLGARGLKLHPTGGWSLRDERTQHVVSMAAARRLPVLVHVGKTADVLSDRNAQPTDFLALAATHPECPFIAGHSGFDLWEDFVQHAAMVPPNVFFDISGWQERVRGDGANVRCDVRALEAAFPGRICFGTDSPFYTFNLISSEQHWLDCVGTAVVGRWAGFDDLYANPQVPALAYA